MADVVIAGRRLVMRTGSRVAVLGPTLTLCDWVEIEDMDGRDRARRRALLGIRALMIVVGDKDDDGDGGRDSGQSRCDMD
jgi:hypothetical protein